MENKISTLKERVVFLAEHKKVIKEDFFKKIGVTSANFRGKAKSTPLNSNAIEKIFSAFPDISLEWLLTGKGKMLCTGAEGIMNYNEVIKKQQDQIDSLILIINKLSDRVVP